MLKSTINKRTKIPTKIFKRFDHLQKNELIFGALTHYSAIS